jgi:hypothetical protein
VNAKFLAKALLIGVCIGVAIIFFVRLGEWIAHGVDKWLPSPPAAMTCPSEKVRP